MPRRPRTHLDNVPLHIVQRGHNREPCFAAEEDYFTYLHWLDVALKDNGCALHAYALMTNHVHLLLPQQAASVPRLVMSLGRRYVQYINTTYRRTGTLWDSRYKSSLIQADTYLLQYMRYIELNPVRAAMVDDPAHYRWTSYRSNALGQANTIVSPHPLYMAMSSTGPRQQSAYRALFRAHLDAAAVAELRLALNQNQPLGDNRFYANIERMMGERRQPRPRGRPKAVDTGQPNPASQGRLPL